MEGRNLARPSIAADVVHAKPNPRRRRAKRRAQKPIPIALSKKDLLLLRIAK